MKICRHCRKIIWPWNKRHIEPTAYFHLECWEELTGLVK